MMALLGEHITCDAVHKSVNDIRNTLSKLWVTKKDLDQISEKETC
jgi:hypothetical protein